MPHVFRHALCVCVCSVGSPLCTVYSTATTRVVVRC